MIIAAVVAIGLLSFCYARDVRKYGEYQASCIERFRSLEESLEEAKNHSDQLKNTLDFVLTYAADVERLGQEAQWFSPVISAIADVAAESESYTTSEEWRTAMLPVFTLLEETVERLDSGVWH